MDSNFEFDTETDLKLDELFSTIRQVTVLWADLEDRIDRWIAVIHGDYGGKQMFGQVPVSGFKKKTKYLRKWWNSPRTKKPDFWPIPPIADNLDQLADGRHWVIHGAAHDVGEYLKIGKYLMKRQNKDNPGRYGLAEINFSDDFSPR